MSVVSYTALRELTGGASENDTIVLDLQLQGLDLGRNVERSVHTSLNGDRETVYIRGETTWNASTRPLTGQDVSNMIMFLASVESGQSFSFSAYQTSADSPITYSTVVLSNTGFSQPRAVMKGGGGSNDYFTFGFSLVEVP